REYAVLKTLGFSGRHLVGLIFGEALLIAVCGGLLGLALTFPMVAGFGKALPTFFPIINVAPLTIALALGAALVAGAVAALLPAARVVRTPIVTGLRTVGERTTDAYSFLLHLAQRLGPPPHAPLAARRRGAGRMR